VKNYTGDRLNFGLAAELARVEGLEVELVLVADDVALDVAPETRRGIAGTVFVHKIAGALAAMGAPLATIVAAARDAAATVGTMGVALGPCIVPAAGTPSFTLGESEIELGLGIHGEAGVRRVPIAPARDLVEHLLTTIIASRKLTAGERVALLVNDLGATPPMELDIVTAAALRSLSRVGIVVERVWCGRFLTSLEMPGVSLSLLSVDDERLRLLDAPTDASAWPSARLDGQIDVERPRVRTTQAGSNGEVSLHADGSAHAATLRAGLEAVIGALRENETRLTALDQAVGDGDLGISMTRAVDALDEQLGTFDLDDPAATLAAISGLVRRVVGGTSGPLYAIFLLRGARCLAQAQLVDAAAWSAAFLAGCHGVAELGGAKAGDRTMLDALLPAAHTFAHAIGLKTASPLAWQSAVSAAREGATATQTMLARRGRSQYLGERVLTHPDPGAVAAAIWLEALLPAVRALPAAHARVE
jgi:dihydroxyacetone kinase